MDNITHALAGLLLADVTTALVARRGERPVPPTFRRVATVVGIAAAELPDADLLYAGPVLGMGKLGYLLHHRGHTHTIVWAVLGALALWWGARWWWHRRADDDTARWWHRYGAMPLLMLAIVGALSHLLLDWTNSYGVHPFWPIDNRWFYGDTIFIVEPWLWVLIIPGVWWGDRSRFGRVVLAGLLLLIVAAMWGLGQVAPAVATAATVTALIGMVVQRHLAATTRMATALLLWIGTTAVFAVSKAEAREQLAHTAGTVPLTDVVLNPAPGDPTCWGAIVVSGDAVLYRVSTAWSRHGR